MADSHLQRRTWLTHASVLACSVAWLGGCSSPPKVAQSKRSPVVRHPISLARNERDYRQDVARHLYQHNQERIYKGKLPPLLYAIGVTRMFISAQGEVLDVEWMRIPKQAPEVVATIERTMKAAAPYPVAPALSRWTYTETWLWDKSGRFQLDTLTEGQS